MGNSGPILTQKMHLSVWYGWNLLAFCFLIANLAKFMSNIQVISSSRNKQDKKKTRHSTSSSFSSLPFMCLSVTIFMVNVQREQKVGNAKGFRCSGWYQWCGQFQQTVVCGVWSGSDKYTPHTLSDKIVHTIGITLFFTVSNCIKAGFDCDCVISLFIA